MSPSVSAILLAAGYGTRLYPLTKDCPKALLELGDGVVLDVMLNALKAIPGLSQIALVTNHRFVDQFQAWQSSRKVDIELIDDGSSTPDTRLGAIRDLLLALSRVGPTEDVLVVGTDNVFAWSLADFVTFAKTKRPAASIALRQVASADEARRCGVVTIDRHDRLLDCLEKPARPPSLIVAVCVYYFPAPCRRQIERFVQQGGNADAPGHFIEWLVTHDSVYGFMTHGEWFDIGSQESYDQAVRWLSGRPGTRLPLPSGSGRLPPKTNDRRQDR